MLNLRIIYYFYVYYGHFIDEFLLELLEDVDNPKYKFYVLFKNGKSFYEEFVDSLKQAQDLDELDSIIALMDKVDNNNLPPKKFNHIVGQGKRRKDVYEFKSKHLRVYVIKKSPDFYIVLGGFKKTQEKDIDRVFRHFNVLPDYIPIKAK